MESAPPTLCQLCLFLACLAYPAPSPPALCIAETVHALLRHVWEALRGVCMPTHSRLCASDSNCVVVPCLLCSSDCTSFFC